MFWTIMKLFRQVFRPTTWILKDYMGPKKLNPSHPDLPHLTVRARELQFWEYSYLPPCVMCHTSHAVWNMSHVTFTCHLSHVMCLWTTCFFFYFLIWFLLDKVVKPVHGGSVINRNAVSSPYVRMYYAMWMFSKKNTFAQALKNLHKSYLWYLRLE